MITSSVKACCVLCRSSWGIVAKHRRPGGLNARHLWSHSSGGQMSQVKLSTGFVSSEAPLLGMQAALLLLYLHITFPVCVCVQDSLVYKDSAQIDVGPTLMTSS